MKSEEGDRKLRGLWNTAINSIEKLLNFNLVFNFPIKKIMVHKNKYVFCTLLKLKY